MELSGDHWTFLKFIVDSCPSYMDYTKTQRYRELFESIPYIINDPEQIQVYNYYFVFFPLDITKDTLNQWINCIPHDDLVKFNMITYLREIGQHYPEHPSFNQVLQYKNFYLAFNSIFPQYYSLREHPIDPYLSTKNQFNDWETYLTEPFINSPKNVSIIVGIILLAIVTTYKYISSK